MEEIVYGTSVTPQEYNQLRMAVGWYEAHPAAGPGGPGPHHLCSLRPGERGSA